MPETEKVYLLKIETKLSRFIKQKITMNNLNTTNNEYIYPDHFELVSTTDKAGVITYANEAFCLVSGYTQDELIGQHHNIVRHPDMPKAAFGDLWDKLEKGLHWRGAVIISPEISIVAPAVLAAIFYRDLSRQYLLNDKLKAN